MDVSFRSQKVHDAFEKVEESDVTSNLVGWAT